MARFYIPDESSEYLNWVMYTCYLKSNLTKLLLWTLRTKYTVSVNPIFLFCFIGL